MSYTRLRRSQRESGRSRAHRLPRAPGRGRADRLAMGTPGTSPTAARVLRVGTGRRSSRRGPCAANRCRPRTGARGHRPDAAVELRRIEDQLCARGRPTAGSADSRAQRSSHAPRGHDGKTSHPGARRSDGDGHPRVRVGAGSGACVRGSVPVLPELRCASVQTWRWSGPRAPPRRSRAAAGASDCSPVTVEVGLPGRRSRQRSSDPAPPTEEPAALAPICALEELLARHGGLVRRRRAGSASCSSSTSSTPRPPTTCRSVLNTLQNSTGHARANPLAVARRWTAGDPRGARRAPPPSASAAPSSRSTGSTTRTHAHSWWRRPTAEGVTWSRRRSRRRRDRGSRLPLLLRLIGSSTWDAARPERWGPRPGPQAHCQGRATTAEVVPRRHRVPD